MLDRIKEFLKSLNTKGVFLPLVHDPKSGGPSVSLTLLFISSIYVQVGLVGKYSKLLETIDINQAINWFYGCAVLYLGRNLKTNAVSSDKDDSNVNSTQNSSNP